MTNYILPSKEKIDNYTIRNELGSSYLKQFISRNPDILSQTIDEFINKAPELADQYGVLCLTPHWDNLLMWAHYGDAHRGICLGFDIELPHDTFFGNGRLVEYSEHKPKICMLDFYSSRLKVKTTAFRRSDLSAILLAVT